jgi:hypothetical protein
MSVMTVDAPLVWDPEKLQMVFGDGAEFLNNFTGCIDVIGHEISHAVTEYTTPLNYHGQSGALNEHISDVFGIMIKQKIQDEKADVADWLIGEECILPGVKGVALRSMKAPGKAYNDPRFVCQYGPQTTTAVCSFGPSPLFPLTDCCSRAKILKLGTCPDTRRRSRTMAAFMCFRASRTRHFSWPPQPLGVIPRRRLAESGGRP